MRFSWRLVLGAIVGSSIAAAQPAPATVPLIAIDPPSTFELARLENALDTYVPNAKLAVTTIATGGCDEALAAARAANSPIGFWLHWTADGAVAIEREPADPGVAVLADDLGRRDVVRHAGCAERAGARDRAE